MGVPAIIHKTIKFGIDAGLCVVISVATPDASKDIVGDIKSSSGGWSTDNYLKNPIVLFNNLGDFPVGTMGGVRWKDGQLLGHLILAPENSSERHDEIRKLIQCGVLKGISCSFRPIESVKLKSGATHFFENGAGLGQPYGVRVSSRCAVASQSSRSFDGDNQDDF